MTENTSKELIQCAYCSCDVEKDSFYCDQCGKVLSFCETCGKAGKGKWCEDDGGALKPAQDVLNTEIELREQADTIIGSALSSVDEGAVPELVLTNNSLGSIIIQPNSVLGRTQGDYISYFQDQKTVSGKHLEFLYSDKSGWSVKDLGSTNFTKLYNDRTAGLSTPPLNQNVVYNIHPFSYLLIADIEFTIKIVNESSNQTHRV